MALHIAALSALAATLAIAACGDDGGNGDADEITAVIERVATSGDPAVCTEAQTQRFTETAVGEGITGDQAIKACERNADRGVSDSVEVTDIEVDGSSATANAAITGSTFDGQTLSLALTKDGEQWKLDEFTGFEVFDRETLIASFTNELAAGAPQPLVDCVGERLGSLSDEEIQGFLLNPDEANIRLVFGPCEAGAQPTTLEGTWRTEPVAVADLAETVRRAGLGQHVEAFVQNAPISDAPTSLVLNAREDGIWDLSGQVGERPREPIDYDATYRVEGRTVVVRHGDGNENTLRWSVNGDVLELTWLDGTHPPYRGIPDEAYQRALYMTADFQRQP